MVLSNSRNVGNLLIFVLFILLHVVSASPEKNRFGYDTLEGGYSSRNWGNLYKHGSPSRKIGGSRKPFAQYGAASFYLRSSFGPYYVIGKVSNGRNEDIWENLHMQSYPELW